MILNKFQLSKNLPIFVFCFLLSCVPLLVEAATLYLIPQSQTIYQDDTFMVEIRLNTEGQEINVVQAQLVFPDSLEVIDFSEGNSILTFWLQTPDIKENSISFIGGTPKGFVGDGLISRITFKAKEIAKARIDFQKDSKVLLNDEKGTEAETIFLEGNYQIIKKSDKLPKISSRTHADQNKWYSNNSLHLKWDFEEGTLYSYLLSHDSLTEPDDIPDKPEGELMWLGDMSYSDLKDGIYYFHLKRAASKELVWEPKVTFRAMIDTLPPKEFEPKVSQDPSVFEGKYFLAFATQDTGSGIDHYEVLETRDKKQETGEWKIAQSPYLLEDQSLRSIIKVKAVDKANNEVIVKIIPQPKPTPPYFIIILILITGVVWWLVRKLEAKKQRLKS